MPRYTDQADDPPESAVAEKLEVVAAHVQQSQYQHDQKRHHHRCGVVGRAQHTNLLNTAA